ncbi:RpiB/LacA/LacB family sugar-phosphate isomerase [Candidatus Woesearchaeota archaeon]|nr:RpiB/LacA/LacB family sugar-phosphate isomerase [Candidatus Woesearchaeota archaeon]
MERRTNIIIGADHAGYHLKEKVKDALRKKGYDVEDYGALEYDKNDDYPDYAKKVAEAVVRNKGLGVLFCGSAEGMCIAANKIKGARAISATDAKLVKLAREHNDANILCLPGGGMRKKVKGIGINTEKALKLIDAFLKTKFSNVERHKRRLNKIKKMER